MKYILFVILWSFGSFSFADFSSSVGRVIMHTSRDKKTGQQNCNGVLVAQDVVLTALHCVSYNAEIRPAYFSIGFSADRFAVTKVLYSYMPRKLLNHQNPTSNEMYREDLALAVIEPVPTTFKPAPIDFSAQINFTTTTLVGHSPSENFRMIKVPCVIDTAGSSDNFIVATACNSEPGMSGSPIFSPIEAGGGVIGITITGRENYSFYSRPSNHLWVRAFLESHKD